MPSNLPPKEASVTDVLRPVAPQERIRALDLLRGWAMFGVLWSNLNDGYANAGSVTTLDHALWWTQQWLVESRFYTLLIVLFGIGFGIQLVRADRLDTDLRNTYYRRSAALLAIGIVHGTLIWHGDILTIYALVAFALVMFRTSSTRKILVAAVLLWFVGPIIVRELMVLSGLRFPAPFLSRATRTAIYAHGTWLQIERARVQEYTDWLGHFGLTSYVSILASFLIGLWSIKSGYLRRVIDEPRVTRRLLALSLVAAAIGYARLHWADTVWPFVLPRDNRVPAFPYPGFQFACHQKSESQADKRAPFQERKRAAHLRGVIMKFMVLIYNDSELLDALPQPKFNEEMRGCLAHADDLKKEGRLFDSQMLEGASTAKTIRRRKNKMTVTDGPFTETKEFLAGFNLIEADSMEEAVQMAAEFPWASYGSIEVRPVRDIGTVRKRVGV